LKPLHLWGFYYLLTFFSLFLLVIVVYKNKVYIFVKKKHQNMKNKAIELQEKANQILQMAQDMDKRIESVKLLKFM